MFFNNLPDFSAKKFFFTLSHLQTIYYVFSDPAHSFFSIFLTSPSRKIMVRPLGEVGKRKTKED